MKKTGIILGIILGCFVLVILGVNVYFTDARLKELILPQIESATGKKVEINQLSLSLISAFPNANLEMKGVYVEGDFSHDTLAFINEIGVGVKLIPLISSQVEFDKISISKPYLVYRINKNGKSNIDPILEHLKSESEPENAAQDSSESSFQLNISKFILSDARLNYIDEKAKTTINLAKLDVEMGLRYAKEIETDVSMNLGSLSVILEGSNLVSNLQIGLKQVSNFNADNGNLVLKSGSISVQGLDLSLGGEMKALTSENPTVDLHFESSSKNFGTLLDLVPAQYKEQIKGVETKGSLALKGTVKGGVTADKIPDFIVEAAISDGFLKYPGYDAIQQIQLDFTANNEQVAIKTFKAKAGVNTVDVNGVLKQILTPSILFQLNAKINADLATLKKYYDLKSLDINELNGALSIQANASGNVNEPEKAQFNAAVQLSKGLLKYNYPGVSKPVEQVEIDIVATQSKIDIKKFTASASKNTVDFTGSLQNPMVESSRILSLNGKINADLSTIKEFYPIKEDTLLMRGLLSADIKLSTNLANVEQANAIGKITLTNGYIKHKSTPKAIENINLNADVSRNTIRVNSITLKTGTNQVQAKGIVTDYLKEKPSYNLQVSSQLNLGEVKDFVDIREFVNVLTGSASTNLTVKGTGFDLDAISYLGGISVKNVHIEHDSLPKPVQNLQADLDFSQKDVVLKNLSLRLGKSDAKLNGELKDYLIFVDANRKGTATLTGTYASNLFDLDELINWDAKSQTESNNEPVLIELPNLNSSLNASITKLVAMGVTMSNLKAAARTTPTLIELKNASLDVFDGQVTGAFVWNIPKPNKTNITFNGAIKNVRAEAFFKEYKLTGKDSKLDQYISGGLSIQANYSSELESSLSPDLKTSNGKGNFGMTKSRLKNHPTQMEIASLLGAKEFENIALDDWNATYVLTNGVLAISDMKLTSANLGAELNGTHDLVNDKMDFKMSLYLPGNYSDKLAKLITKDAADALKTSDGRLLVPLKITGSSSKPSVKPDMDVIQPIIEKYLKDKVVDKAVDALKGLIKF